MIEIVERIESNHGAPLAVQLELSFALRQKRQFASKLRTGEAVLVCLPRGPVLRGGDLLRAGDGRSIEVVATPEALFQIESGSPSDLARLAYHLGNRHVAIEVGDGFLRIAEDAVLESMLLGLGARVSRLVAPFEPEAGAYANGHRHSDDGSRGGRIHEYGQETATSRK